MSDEKQWIRIAACVTLREADVFGSGWQLRLAFGHVCCRGSRSDRIKTKRGNQLDYVL